jgi:DGQHR domain-containing protein
MSKLAKKTKAKPAKKTPEQILAAKAKRAAEKITRDHEKLIRNMIVATGFERLPEMVNAQFVFKGQKSDIDDIFVYENVIVISEYTCANQNNVSDHLKIKKIPFDHIRNNQSDFVQYLKNNFPAVAEKLKPIYPMHTYRVAVVYCSRYELGPSVMAQVDSAKYLDYNIAMYFSNLALTIRHSSRHEFLEFIGVPAGEVGMNALNIQSSTGDNFKGSVLPSSHSMFDEGYKVISFYANPAALLERVYVLRREGWRDEANLYQRVIGRKKVDQIRTYLLEKRRVFVNNIIVTLPEDAKVLNDGGDTQNPDSIKKTQPATVSLPKRHNSISVVDGQHRVYSYYEGGDHDDEISAMRQVQNLLVTGIMFPPGTSDGDRMKFEARLFVEINANQTKASSPLMQEIDLIIRPFESSSIAKRIVTLMNQRHNPFNGVFAKYTHDIDKLKTSSIVSYGLKPLVKLGGEDSLYATWTHVDKSKLPEATDSALLNEYIEYCYSNVVNMFIEIRKRLPSGLWTPDKKVAHAFLNPTNVNGIINFQRKIIENTAQNLPLDPDKTLAFIHDFEFWNYKSSHWNRMGTDLFAAYQAAL